MDTLTDDPSTWIDLSAVIDMPMWQSTVNNKAISYDGGKTYILLCDGSDPKKVYTSVSS